VVAVAGIVVWRGGGNNQNSGGVVGIVNAFSGSGGMHSQRTGGGGGGGGQGAANPLDVPLESPGSGGGAAKTTALAFRHASYLASKVSSVAREFFTTLGINLNSPPGKSVFFNDRVGRLLCAPRAGFNTIERAIHTLNESPRWFTSSRVLLKWSR